METPTKNAKYDFYLPLQAMLLFGYQITERNQTEVNEWHWEVIKVSKKVIIIFQVLSLIQLKYAKIDLKERLTIKRGTYHDDDLIINMFINVLTDNEH